MLLIMSLVLQAEYPTTRDLICEYMSILRDKEQVQQLMKKFSGMKGKDVLVCTALYCKHLFG